MLAKRLFADFHPRGVVTPGSGGGGVDQGSIAPFLHAAAPDTVTVLQPGVYNCDGLDIAELQQAATGGRFAGWRIVKAPSPGSVVVDPTGWRVEDGVQHLHDIRMIFAGIDFKNGLQKWEWCQHFYFWYCKYTLPWWEWLAQYTAANGGVTPAQMSVLSAAVLESMPNFTGSPNRVGSCTNFGWFGCDSRHIMDDFVFANNSGTAAWMVGMKQWDNFHHNHQFISPYSNPATYMHPDGYQTRSDGGVHLLDSWLDIIFIANEGGEQDNHVHRVWLAGHHGVGGTFNDDPENGKIMTGSMSDVTCFLNAQFLDPDFESSQTPGEGFSYPYVSEPFVPTDTGWQMIAVNLDVPGSTFPAVRGVNWKFGTDDNGALPTGITNTAAGVATDIANAVDPTRAYDLAQIFTHPDNPANVWRAAPGHAYADVEDYFAGASDSPVVLW